MTSTVQHAPEFSVGDAARIATEHYGIEGRPGPLPSERDQNFRITAPDGAQYVLKLANAREKYQLLDCQNRAMAHIAANGGEVGCPRVCKTLAGKTITAVESPGGSVHHMRLLTYLAGKPLARVKPHDNRLMRRLGAFFGRMDRALADFDHPALHHDFHWDLKHAAAVIEQRIDDIENPAHKLLVRRHLERFNSRAAARLASLRSAVIHNDGNDYNVLAAVDVNLRLDISGVIDFGDMVHTHLVNEPAIVCAYAMMGKNDPLTTAKRIVAGYYDIMALNAAELALVFDLACMRLCMSVCHSAHQGRLEPKNTYLRISERPAWALLEKTAHIHPRLAESTFRQACGLPPVPASARIVRWIKDQSATAAVLVEANLSSRQTPVFDLGVTSPFLDAGSDSAAADRLTRRLFDIMKTARASAGVGRYGEVRLLYHTGAYDAPWDELPERRTLHLGVDIFMAAGSPVYAPLAGTVHSFKDNASYLDYGPTIILEHVTDQGDRFFTLYGHLSRESLAAVEVGQAVAKGQCMAHMGSREVNGGGPPHVHFQIITDLLGARGDFPGVARASQRQLWTSISPDPTGLLGITGAGAPETGRANDEILALRRRHLGKSLSIAYEKPLKIVRGVGQYLYSEDGQAYLDAVNNVCHVGHCHPHVAAAGRRQMPILNTNTRYLHDNIVAYAQRLAAKFPDPLNVCFFVCSGSEANELALRMARNTTGQYDLITVEGAYHGNTQVLIDISPYKHDGPGGRGAPPWVQTVPMPDGYRGPHKGLGPKSGERYARYVRQAVDRIRENGRRPAAFICESMLGCGGQVILPDGYLAHAFEQVRAGGGLCIVDEVQVGFGRVGTHFWAFETQGVVPDIVTLGKPMGNGHPMAAVVTTAAIAEAFANGMEYFNTFGGNPVSCAIGMAVLDVIENEGLQQNARDAGKRLLTGLAGLKAKYPLVGDARGLGLYAGLELVADRSTLSPAAGRAAYIVNRMKDHGILISTDGPLHNVLKFKPPLVFSKTDADRTIEVLDNILQEECLQL